MYEFKKFARQHNFWEEYKRLSYRLGFSKDSNARFYKQVSFIELVKEEEPVKLIQGSSVFCSWPDARNNCGDFWSELSKQWAYFCLKNGLFYDELDALDFVTRFISVGVRNRYIKEKRELQLEFK